MVSPEPPDDAGQILGQHPLFLSSTGQCKQLPGIILGPEKEASQPSKECTPLS